RGYPARQQRRVHQCNVPLDSGAFAAFRVIFDSTIGTHFYNTGSIGRKCCLFAFGAIQNVYL
ncbi:MAG: hypothetical protein R3309_14510, partial [Reinekea sp.]|nr:hypothetical protein [Reinekea sp.]